MAMIHNDIANCSLFTLHIRVILMMKVLALLIIADRIKQKIKKKNVYV